MAPIPAKSPLLNPNQTLSGKALLGAAKALAAAQENPTISGLKGQIGQADTQTKNALGLTGGFYNQLGSQLSGVPTQEGQIGQSLASQLGGIASGTQSALRGIGDNANATLVKYAPESGVAQPALAQEIARQQGLAAQNEGAFKSAGANQAANYQGLASSQVGTGALAGQEALKSIAQAGIAKEEPLTNRLAAAIATRGALVGTDLAKLRQQEIANRVTEQGLGIKSLSARAALANAQTNRMNANTRVGALKVQQQNDLANQAIKTSQLNERTQNDQATQLYRQESLNLKASKQNGSGGTKPLTTNENNLALRYLNEATTLIRQGRQAGHSDQALRNALATGSLQKGFPAQAGYITDAAFELLNYGQLTPATAAQLHKAGIRGGSFGGGPIRVAKGAGPGSQRTVVNNAANAATNVQVPNPFG